MKDYYNYEINKEKFLSDINKQTEQSFYKNYEMEQRSNYNYSIAATIADYLEVKDIQLYKVSNLANILTEIPKGSTNIVSQGKGLTLYYYTGEKVVIEISIPLDSKRERVDKITILPKKAKWEAFDTTPVKPIDLKKDNQYDKGRVTYIAKYIATVLNYINSNNLNKEIKIKNKNING